LEIILTQKDKAMSTTTPFTPPEKKYLSSDGARKYAEDYASITLSKARLWALTSKGKVPHLKGAGGKLLFPIDKFRVWLETGEVNGEV